MISISNTDTNTLLRLLRDVAADTPRDTNARANRIRQANLLRAKIIRKYGKR